MISAEQQHEELKLLLADWHRRARQSQRLQYEAANRCMRFHYAFGIPSVIVSAIVAMTALISLFGENSLSKNIITAGFSVLGVILASLQTFMRYYERAEQYRRCSAQYGAVRRELEFLMTILLKQPDVAVEKLDLVKKRMDELAEGSQAIPSRIKKRGVKDLEAKPRKHPLFTPYDLPRDLIQKTAELAETAPKNLSKSKPKGRNR